MTKHWSSYSVLFLGRILGGIATSLLTTAFESWLVSEHLRRGYEPQWLSGTFSAAVFLGNGAPPSHLTALSRPSHTPCSFPLQA